MFPEPPAVDGVPVCPEVLPGHCNGDCASLQCPAVYGLPKQSLAPEGEEMKQQVVSLTQSSAVPSFSQVTAHSPCKMETHIMALTFLSHIYKVSGKSSSVLQRGLLIDPEALTILLPPPAL